MRKPSVSIPFVTWRDGRPRYFAGPLHRRLGFKGEDLRHQNGAWFTYEEAAAWSAARVAQVEAARAQLAASGRPRRVPARGQVGGAITVAGLFERWFKSPRMTGQAVVSGLKRRRPLSASTVRSYKEGARIVEAFDGGRVWATPAAAISGKAWAGIIDRIEVARGLHSARKVRATVSAAYSFGVKHCGLPGNPLIALQLDLPVPDARIRYGAIAEMAHLVRAADVTMRWVDRKGEDGRAHPVQISCADIGDAIVLGLWTGQRQNDRLALEDGRDTPQGLVFRQNKKGGQPLLIPKAPELAQRLADARARRAGWRVNYPNVILDEATRRPFLKRWYAALFAKVRDTATRGLRADGTPGPVLPREARIKPADYAGWLLPPMPSLADFRDQDLRDTAVTWLALAGCGKFEIASITGHSLKSIDTILSHYLGMHPELARSAIAKLVAWHEQQGDKNG